MSNPKQKDESTPRRRVLRYRLAQLVLGLSGLVALTTFFLVVWYAGYDSAVWIVLAVGVAITAFGVIIGMLIKPPRLVGLYLRGFDKAMGPTTFHDAIGRATRFIRIGSLYHFETTPFIPLGIKVAAGIPAVGYAMLWMRDCSAKPLLRRLLKSLRKLGVRVQKRMSPVFGTFSPTRSAC